MVKTAKRMNERWSNNKLLVRLVVSFLITSIVFTVILMFAVSAYINRSIQEKTTQTQIDFMRHSYNTTYYALTDIYVDFYQVWSKDSVINQAMNEQNLSSEVIKQATNTINTSVFKDELVDSVYLINKQADVILSSVHSPQSVDSFYDASAITLLNDFETNYNQYKDEVFFPRVGDTINQTKKNYISIVYASKNEQGNLDAGLIVNIDQTKLSTLLTPTDYENSMIIINRAGQIILDSSRKDFASSLDKDSLYDSIATNQNVEDSFIGYYNNEKSFVTFKKANSLGFVFVSVTPYRLLLDEVSSINKMIALFFFLAILVNLAVSVISIKHIYQPLNNLIQSMKHNAFTNDSTNLDEYAFLEQTYKSLLLKNKRAYVFSLFKGNQTEVDTNKLGLACNKYLTLSIVPDQPKHRYPELLDQLLDLIEHQTSWIGSLTSTESLSFLVGEDDFDEITLDAIMEMLVNVQTNIHNTLDVSVSIGIGTIITALDHTSYSYRYAQLAVNYALSMGENQIVFYHEIEDTKLAASVNQDNIADKIEAYVKQNYMRQDFSVEEIAEDIGLSLGYIRQIFKAQKDITLNEFVISYRLDKAKELLVTTNKTAKDISEAVGYYDNRYFYTLFKKRVGQTTEEYRQTNTEVTS